MKKLKGFTLVELLVVVAIIGILSTVVVININGAQKKARRTAFLSNINQALKLASACIVDEGTLVVPGGTATSPYDKTELNGANICTGGSASLNAQWPKPSTGYDFGITMTSSGITTVTATMPSGDQETGVATGLSCTASSCSYTSS